MTGADEADHGDARLVQALDALAGVQLELHAERLRVADATELLDGILGAMSDALVLTDARGSVARLNDAALRLLGREVDAGGVVGEPVERVLGPGVPATAWQLFEQAPGGKLQLETTLPTGPSGLVDVSVSCGALRDGEGKVVGVLYLARDLTATQRLLRQVEDAEARWRLLAQVSEELSAFTPDDALPAVCGHVSAAASCGAALVLVAGPVVDRVILPADGAGAADAVVEDVREEVRQEVRELASRPVSPATALGTVVRTRRTVHAEVMSPDFPLLGTRSPSALRSAALVPLAAERECLGALLLFSERPGGVQEAFVRLVEEVAGRVALVLAHAGLRRSLAELEAAQEVNRVRQDILAGLSHDMKTPLAVLTGSLDILHSVADLAPDRRFMIYEAMSSQARRLRRLVLQFLDYTQLQSGFPLVLNLTPVNVRDAVDAIVTTAEARTAVEVDVPADVPPVLADPDRLDQMLANLVSNAVKFSPLRARVVVSARGVGDEVEVSVVDHGQGISPADQAKLFERYERGSGGAGRSGTGLGLYLTRAMVEAHGGRISVSSRVGEGSRFTIVLPRAPTEDATDLR